MSVDAKNKTTKCRFGFSCLDKESVYPLCTVIDAVGENLMFVKTDVAVYCPHRGTFGFETICLCPMHFCLHKKCISN